MPEHFSAAASDFVASLLKVDPVARLDAETALAHSWLNLRRDDGDEPPPLDPSVLNGMRCLAQSNALRRAILSAVAPVATVKEVSRWADQFEAMDLQGKGTIPVLDFAARLAADPAISAEEAAVLSAALAESSADGGGDEVSYSTFLAACFSQHVQSYESTSLRAMFDGLDRDDEGNVSLDAVGKALGSTVDLTELAADLDFETTSSRISYDEFRWLLLQPARGIRQVLTAAKLAGGFSTVTWRVDTARAKTGLATDVEAMEARRRENAAWRIWWRDGGPASVGMPHPTQVAAGSPLDGAPASEISVRTSMHEDSSKLIGSLAADPQAAWSVSTARAKKGGGADAVDAARRENMAWRMLHVEKERQ